MKRTAEATGVFLLVSLYPVCLSSVYSFVSLFKKKIIHCF